MSKRKLTWLGLLLSLLVAGIAGAVAAPPVAALAAFAYLGVGARAWEVRGGGQTFKVLLWLLAAWVLLHFIWLLFGGAAAGQGSRSN